MARPTLDALVIGAGFFGAEIALELRRIGFARVLLVEREPGLLRRASYVNQARVHNGYHYPRSLATAERSRANFDAFVADYPEAVQHDMQSVYAIARFSRVNAAQFETFCRMIGVPCHAAPRRIAELFDPALIEAAYITRELAFDAARLATRLAAALQAAGVMVQLDTPARIVGGDAEGVDVATRESRQRARYVFNCTYADIAASGVALRSAVKRELAEMVLIEPPPELRGVAVTVMDGPFFSTMPFPAASLHSLSHVRYTPHESITADSDHALQPRRSHRQAMLRDAARFLPCLSRARVAGSMFEVKATLARNEDDDGRPVLIERAAALPRVLSVLGAKIDNIYDVRRYLRTQAWDLAA